MLSVVQVRCAAMISSLPTPSLEAQFLTEARVAWVLDFKERTLRAWRAQDSPPIPFCNFGQQLVRYDPQVVAATILANTRGRLGPQAMQWIAAGSEASELKPFWDQMARLVRSQVEASIERNSPSSDSGATREAA